MADIKISELPNEIVATLDGDFFLDDSNLTIPNVAGGNIPPLPVDGQLSYDSTDGQVLVFDSGSGSANWKPLAPNAPQWEEVYFAFEVDNEVVGIFHTVQDMSSTQTYTLYAPGTNNVFRALRAKELDAMEYDTHVQFETFPVLQEHKTAPGGILLTMPKE